LCVAAGTLAAPSLLPHGPCLSPRLGAEPLPPAEPVSPGIPRPRRPRKKVHALPSRARRRRGAGRAGGRAAVHPGRRAAALRPARGRGGRGHARARRAHAGAARARRLRARARALLGPGTAPRPPRSPTARDRLLPAALGPEACLAPVRGRVGLTRVCWAAQLAYAGVTLASYAAAYAPELAAQLRKRQAAAASGAACEAPPAAPASWPACSTRPAAALGARRRAGAAEPDRACRAGGGQPDQVQLAGGADEGQGARGGVAKGAAAERSRGADADASVRDTRPAAASEQRGAQSAGHCGGAGQEQRPLLEGRTLRLCASFTLQA